MSLTNTFETRVLQWLLTTTAVTRPTTWFVGLFTAAPGEAGGGTEITGNGYARQSATFNVSGNAASNSNTIEFPTATAAWGTVTHAAVFDASTGGNMITYMALTASKVVGAGDVIRIPIGALTHTAN